MDIVVMGTGNIGRRHIQAIANLKSDPDNNLSLSCYDISTTAINGLSEFLRNNNIVFDDLALYTDYDSILSRITSNSIVILATTAQNRLDQVSPIYRRLPKAVILEKPVAQSLGEFNEILRISRELKVATYVNFIARVQSIYQRIKEAVNDSKQLTMYTHMPRWGMSTVGVHQIDLFIYLSGLSNLDIESKQLKAVYEQKRQGFQDATGHLVLRGKNALAVINNSNVETTPSCVQLITDTTIYSIFESEDLIIEVDKKNGLVHNKVNIRFVSQYMHEQLLKCYRGEKLELATLQESILAHEILFEFMRDAGEINIT